MACTCQPKCMPYSGSARATRSCLVSLRPPSSSPVTPEKETMVPPSQQVKLPASSTPRSQEGFQVHSPFWREGEARPLSDSPWLNAQPLLSRARGSLGVVVRESRVLEACRLTSGTWASSSCSLPQGLQNAPSRDYQNRICCSNG